MRDATVDGELGRARLAAPGRPTGTAFRPALVCLAAWIGGAGGAIAQPTAAETTAAQAVVTAVSSSGASVGGCVNHTLHLSGSPDADGLASRHVRGLTPAARVLIGAGIRASPTFRSLLGDLARTDVIVLVVTGRWEHGEGGCHANCRFVTATSGNRLVRVWVDAWWGTRRQQTALLAHELQHALEIGQEPGVRSDDDMAALFRRIGYGTRDRRYDTRAALMVGSAVDADLGSSRLPESHAVSAARR
jgi:hypothetical protein